MTLKTHRWALSGRCADCGVERLFARGDYCGNTRATADTTEVPEAVKNWPDSVETTFGPLPTDGEGRKDDTGKAPYDLLAPEFLTATAEILAFGAAKYAPRNWEKGMAWSRPFSALMRHMWSWWAGEQTDAETGKSHLWHAACCLMFLVAYEQRKTGHDDRPNSA
jgi:hypothetical protein